MKNILRFHSCCPLHWALAFCLLSQTYVFAQNPINLINFEDGVIGQTISNNYQQFNIAFQNALYTSPATGFGTPTNLIALTNVLPEPNFPNSTNPIVVSFNNPVNYIEVSAFDVGSYGARLDAFDSLSGGSLIGRSEIVGSGAGVGTVFQLTVSQPEIFRIELYQQLQPVNPPNRNDGLKWDNMQFRFAAVPEPRHYFIAGIVFLVIVVVFLRRRFAQVYLDSEI